MDMKLFFYRFFIALFVISSYTLTSCSDDDGVDGGNSGNIGSLIINGDTWKCELHEYSGGEDPSVTGNYTGAVYEVNEGIQSLRLQKILFKPEDGSLIDRTMRMVLEFDRFNLEETPKGTDITSHLTNAYIDRAEPYYDGPSWQGVVKSGAITFDGLSDYNHYINVRFNNVILEMTDKNGVYYDQTYTIDGIVRFARDDYWARPAFPVFELSLNNQQSSGSTNGIWEISQSPYIDQNVVSQFRFDNTNDVLSIEIVKTISDNKINAQLDGYAGKNIANEDAVSFSFGRYGNSAVEYVSGSVVIENYKKLGFLFMHPDISFSFDNFTFKQGNKVYTVNGKATVVYNYTEY